MISFCLAQILLAQILACVRFLLAQILALPGFRRAAPFRVEAGGGLRVAWMMISVLGWRQDTTQEICTSSVASRQHEGCEQSRYAVIVQP